MKKRAKKAVHHGFVGTRTYSSWRAMKNRCTNKKSDQWNWYGGRGITVCDRWRYDFQLFLEDMGVAPTESHSIDRIDTNGNYEPGNCRWATPKEQQANQRKRVDSVYLTFQGETLTVSEWAKRVPITRSTIFSRIRNGWDTESILTLPRRCGVSPGGWRILKAD